MKALYLTSALVALAGLCASAQTVVNNPNNKAYVGIRASLDIPAPGDVKVGGVKTDLYKNGVGVDGGFIVNVPIVANLYVEPGVNFYYNAYGVKNSGVAEAVIKNRSIRQSGMRVPVTLGYHFDFTPDVNLAVFAGPELQVGFSSDDYTTFENTDRHIALSNYSNDQLHRVACNLKFGVGFNFMKNYYAGVEGAVGLTNLSSVNNVNFKENRVSVTLGYNFK